MTWKYMWRHRPGKLVWGFCFLVLALVYVFASDHRRHVDLLLVGVLEVAAIAYVWAFKLWPDAMLQATDPSEYVRRRREQRLLDAYVELFTKAEQATNLPHAMTSRANIVVLNQYLADLRALARTTPKRDRTPRGFRKHVTS